MNKPKNVNQTFSTHSFFLSIVVRKALDEFVAQSYWPPSTEEIRQTLLTIADEIEDQSNPNTSDGADGTTRIPEKSGGRDLSK